MYKTRWGLNVRAVGDNPKACATAGLNVIKTAYQTVILSGIMAALAGCTLTLATSGYFAAGGMTNGRGFIVLAAVVVGGWDPIRTMLSCVLFGAADALQMRPQITGSVIPTQFLPDAALCHYGHCADHYGQALPRTQDLGCGLRSA